MFRGFFLIKLIVWLFPFIFLFSKLFLQKQTFTSVHQRTSVKNFIKFMYSSSSIKLQAATLYWKDYIIGFFSWILKKLQFFCRKPPSKCVPFRSLSGFSCTLKAVTAFLLLHLPLCTPVEAIIIWLTKKIKTFCNRLFRGVVINSLFGKS